MNPDNARKTLLNTDYPLDKVLETFSGSFVPGARVGPFQPRLTTHHLSHDFGDWGLINGTYSINGGVTWFQFGVTDADLSSFTPTFQTVEVGAYCTTSEVVLLASNYLPTPVNVFYSLQVMARE